MVALLGFKKNPFRLGIHAPEIAGLALVAVGVNVVCTLYKGGE